MTTSPEQKVQESIVIAQGDQLALGPASTRAEEHVPGPPSSFALRYRSFVNYLVGSSISWVGDWMDLVTLNWAVLQLTDSPFNLGLMNACRLIPIFLLSYPAGILADRLDRKKLLFILQFIMMLLTFVVGWLILIQAPFWLFTLVVSLRAMMGSMTLPVRNALVSNLVPLSALSSAIAIQSAAKNLSRIAGPAVAGVLLIFMPLQSLFWINGFSFVLVLGMLWFLKAQYSDRVRKPGDETEAISAFRYVKNSKVVQSLLVLAIVPMVFGFPYTTLMPVFARDLLGIGPARFGALLSLAALGAFLGSFFLSAKRIESVGVWLVGSILGFGLNLALFTLAPRYWMAACLMFLVGLLSQIYRTMSRITIQVEVPDELRGRILSLAMMDRGFIPLGALMLGAIAEWGGARVMGLTMGLGCVLVTLLVVLLRPQIWSMQLERKESDAAKR